MITEEIAFSLEKMDAAIDNAIIATGLRRAHSRFYLGRLNPGALPLNEYGRVDSRYCAVFENAAGETIGVRFKIVGGMYYGQLAAEVARELRKEIALTQEGS